MVIIISLTVHITCLPTGLDYESCPTMEECENNAVDSFWRMASITVNSALMLTLCISEHVLGSSRKQCWIKKDLKL